MVDSKYDSSPIALVRNSLFVVRFLCRSIGRPTSIFPNGKICWIVFFVFYLCTSSPLRTSKLFEKRGENFVDMLDSWLSRKFYCATCYCFESIPYEIDTIILRDFPFSVFLALFMFVIYLLLLVRKIKMRTKITG